MKEYDCFFLVLTNEVTIMVQDKIILGIDPGTTVLGYGLIHVKDNKIKLINFGIIQLNKITNHPDKLKKIFDRLTAIIKEYSISG